MFPLITEWEASQENQYQFCDSRGLSPSVFSYWRKKYLEDQTPDNPSFTEILPEVDAKIEVCYPNGVKVNLPQSGSSLATIQALLRLV
ncbi:MAG: transposase [Reichenbachiella sp.]